MVLIGDQAIVTEPTQSPLGGTDISEAGWRGGEKYLKLGRGGQRLFEAGWRWWQLIQLLAGRVIDRLALIHLF